MMVVGTAANRRHDSDGPPGIPLLIRPRLRQTDLRLRRRLTFVLSGHRIAPGTPTPAGPSRTTVTGTSDGKRAPGLTCRPRAGMGSRTLTAGSSYRQAPPSMPI